MRTRAFARMILGPTSWWAPAALVAACVSALGGVAACGGGPLVTSSVVAPSSSARHPDGVMLDPPAAIPDGSEKAPARGVVALREPAAESEALAAVHDFFQAFVHMDKEAMRLTLSPHASQLDAHGAGSADSLRAFFELRMRTFDYSKLAGTELYRTDDIERFSFDELGEGSARARPPEMIPGDLLVRVPMLTPRAGSDRLFGDVVVLLLRREEGHLKVAGYGEDSAP